MAGRCACNQACSCCTQSSSSIDVAGTGALGSCFVPQVNYSDNLKNRAQPGSDGGVFVAPQCLVSSQGASIASGADGCVTLPPPVILNYAGNPIAPDGTGRIALPPAAAPAYGDGLDTLPDGTLIAAVSGAFPTAGLAGTVLGGSAVDGADIYIDDFGQLRAPPEHTAINASGGGDIFTTSLLAISSTYTTPATDPVMLINPSPARQMLLIRYVYVVVDVSTPPQSRPVLTLQGDFGEGWVGLRTLSWPELSGGTSGIRFEGVIPYLNQTVIAPNDSGTSAVRCIITKAGSGDADPVLIYAKGVIQMIGITQ